MPAGVVKARDYLQTALERLDLLLHREILRLRAVYQLSLDEFRGLYISDEQVDGLIREAAQSKEGLDPAEMTRRADALHSESLAVLAEDLRWSRLREEFNFSFFEMDVVLLALALEVHVKYETLFAYLNNDISRKWPTCDLALRLFAPSGKEKLRLRRFLLPESALFHSGVLQPVPAATDRPSWHSAGFTLAPAVWHFLLALPAGCRPTNDFIERVQPAADSLPFPFAEKPRELLARLPGFFRGGKRHGPAPFLVFEGRYGAGGREAAEELCAQLGFPLLSLRLEAASPSGEQLRKLARALLLEQRLEGAGIYLADCQALFDSAGHPTAEAQGLVEGLAAGPGPIIFSCELGTRWRDLLRGRRKLLLVFADPEYEERGYLWRALGAVQGITVSAPVAEDLANRFILSPGQIRDAIQAARDARILRGGTPDQVGAEDLLESARGQSHQGLGKLAGRVRGAYTWQDLVLPPATLRKVKEVAAAIQFRHLVYSQWGFDQGRAGGKGLKVLFSGASGTGKTMTAGVIAADLGLDLYKIDLSGVVSKFIGETEKNLDQIFRAAQAGNAILFFDEADALFGKRSEVKDAHDRYANIEVAYLLQKIEDHDGVVILASNLSKNMDEAFARRMHYVVDFPLPDARHRERLWRGMFPAQAPLSPDVDFAFLAERFQLAGGDIRNVVLSAAFLAARDGRTITMKQLIRALAQQMVKQGRVPSLTEFKQYYAWAAPGDAGMSSR